MPRYFFHVEDGVSPPDDQGVVLEDLAAAREYAVRYAGYVLRDEAAEFLESDGWRVVVCDAAGLAVFSMNVSIGQNAGTRRVAAA